MLMESGAAENHELRSHLRLMSCSFDFVFEVSGVRRRAKGSLFE
jgi:hypothetical protein